MCRAFSLVCQAQSKQHLLAITTVTIAYATRAKARKVRRYGLCLWWADALKGAQSANSEWLCNKKLSVIAKAQVKKQRDLPKKVRKDSRNDVIFN